MSVTALIFGQSSLWVLTVKFRQYGLDTEVWRSQDWVVRFRLSYFWDLGSQVYTVSFRKSDAGDQMQVFKFWQADSSD